MKRYMPFVVVLMAAWFTGLSNAHADMTVSRALITTAISGHEPLDNLTVVPSNVGKVYLFTEIRDSTVQREIKHVWYYEGELVTEVQLSVNGSRFRTWSSKEISPQMTGDWKVEAVSDTGNILKVVQFEVRATEK